MTLTTMISELRLEREGIEGIIISVLRSNRLGTDRTGPTTRSTTVTKKRLRTRTVQELRSDQQRLKRGILSLTTLGRLRRRKYRKEIANLQKTGRCPNRYEPKQ
jgi:hypothetical protein